MRSVLEAAAEPAESEREAWQRGEEMYRALGTPQEENQLGEALWTIMAALKQRKIRYPKIFLRRAMDIKERKWHPKRPAVELLRCSQCPQTFHSESALIDHEYFDHAPKKSASVLTPDQKEKANG